MGTTTTQNATAPTRLVSSTAAARELGIPYSTFQAAVHRGELRPVLVGRTRGWYFERTDIAQWVESRKRDW